MHLPAKTSVFEIVRVGKECYALLRLLLIVLVAFLVLEYKVVE